MKSKKKVILLVMLMVLAVAFSACNQSKPAEKQPDTPDTAQETTATQEQEKEEVVDPVVVRIVTNGQEEQNTAFVEAFNAMRSDIQIEYQFMPTDQYMPFMNSTLGTPDGADITWGSVSTNMWAAAGLIEPLDDYIARDEFDLSLYYPATVQQQIVNGKMYGLPKSLDTYAMAYNKAIFDKYGVDYPTADWDWNDYDRIARELDAAIKAAGGSEFASMLDVTSSVHFFVTLCNGNGIDLISSDMSECLINDPASVELIDMVMGLINDGVQADVTTLTETRAGEFIRNGQAGLMEMPSFKSALGILADSEVVSDIVLLPWPKGPSTGTRELNINTTSNWVMNAGSENKDAAWEVMKYLCGEEGDEIYVTMKAHLPALKSNMQLWIDTFPGLDVTVYADQVETLGEVSYPNNYLNILMVIAPNIRPMFAGEITPEEGLANLEAAINALLAENNQ